MAGQVDEIKARIDIVDLVSEYIRLKQAGTNWRALCPFHNEKTPSFMVSRDKQIWHCFGCSEGGDIFSFIQKMEGLEFPEALRLLAQKAGVKLVSQDPKLASQRNRLLDVCQLAARFWHQVLLESAQAESVRTYLKNQRQINQTTIEDFKLGYAADSWDTLIKFLKNKGFSDQEIFLAGLSVKKERANDFYDRFRGRLMFPINDLHASPIGFSGRTLKAEEKAGKYINTPQTLIYNKSLVVFNLDKAKEFIKKDNLAVAVEGQMDVLAAWQAGTKNVIATSGTALTLDQLQILKRYTDSLAIAFDADLAGQSAAKRGIDLALGRELNVKVIVLPQGKDPDECIKNNPGDWLAAVKQAKSIMEYYFSQTLGRVNLNQVEGKKEAAKILLPVIAKIGNKIEQAHWLQKLAELLQVSESVLRESLPTQKSPKAADQFSPAAPPAKTRDLMMAERILAIALKYPSNISYLINNLLPEVIIDGQLQNLYKQLIIYYTEGIGSNFEDFDYQEFSAKIKTANLVQPADQLVLLAEKDFFDFDSEIIKEELITTINFFKKSYYLSKLKAIELAIKKAETAGRPAEVKSLAGEFNELVAQLNLLE